MQKLKTCSESPSSTLFLLRSLWLYLPTRRQLQLMVLLVVMLISGIAEIITLGAVIPFLSILTSPTNLLNNPLIYSTTQFLNITNPRNIIIFATTLFLVAVVFSAIIRLLNIWLNARLAASVATDLSFQAFTRTLYQPYQKHCQRNSSTLIASLTTQLNRTVVAITSFLQVATASVVALFIVVGLMLIDGRITVLLATLLGIAYGVLAVTVKKELQQNSLKIVSSAESQVKVLQESLGGIRDIIMQNSQSVSCEKYLIYDSPQRILKAKNLFLGSFPRYVIEAFGLVAIGILGCSLVLRGVDTSEVLALLAVFGLGAQRLLPSLQQIYSGWVLVKGCSADLSSILGLLRQNTPYTNSSIKPINFTGSIKFTNVSYQYISGNKMTLKNLNFEINLGDKIGVIGTTGCGKSTLIDVLMGLLPPSKGILSVDNRDVYDTSDSLISWRNAIGHVPQNIFLTDNSIAENIAFGVQVENIDHNLVRAASSKAEILDFIESLPSQYETLVGERGVRLSGGQRQRLGLARAFYKNSKILILDEATSALDSDTEKKIIANIDCGEKDMTVIMIAHRLSTLSMCDKIIELEEGAIKKIAPPDYFFK